MTLALHAVYKSDTTQKLKLVLCSATIPAGFPSPAEDYTDKMLDLNEHLIRHPAATFFVKVAGHSMINAGIHNGDTLIVDRALEPADKKIVIAVINGEMTVKRLRKLQGRIYLMPENDAFTPIEITEDSDFQIWGVVSTVIHPV